MKQFAFDLPAIKHLKYDKCYFKTNYPGARIYYILGPLIFN
ncbi:hypothetical protein FHW88_005482 [Mucilaginibacter sp. SG538B]|nr:hypothetical protein [Mucilaginibacter sp. SG538B]